MVAVVVATAWADVAADAAGAGESSFPRVVFSLPLAIQQPLYFSL